MIKLYNELQKNFKLLFRNPASLSLLVISPLVLILLLGFAYSGEEIHDVRIGYVSQGDMDISSFQENASNYATLIEYDSIEECVADLLLQNNRICLILEGNFTNITSTIPTGKITFYYDNSQKGFSNALISKITEFFGEKAKDISLVSAQKMFGEIQNLVYFLNERIDDIQKIKNDSESIKQDLIDRKAKLISVHDDFLPKYLAIKEIQQNLNNYSKMLNDSVDELDKQILAIQEIENSLDILLQDIDYTPIINKTFEYNITDICNTLNWNYSLVFNETGYNNLSEICNSTNGTINLTTSEYLSIISSLNNQTTSNLTSSLNNISLAAHSVRDNLTNMKAEFDSLVLQLDEINTLLEEEINRSDYYVLVIDQSVAQITNVTDSLSTKMEKLVNFDPSLAEKLINPISKSFEELVPNLKNIQASYPVILATIAVFISILFSNVVTILEINSKAYIRDLLAPVNDLIFTLGLAATNFITVMAQMFVLLLVGEFRFGLNIIANLPNILPIVCLLIIIFMLLGMFFAYVTSTTQTSILLTTFLSLGFFMISDAFTPLETMDPTAAAVASFNPVGVGTRMLRMTIIFGVPLQSMLFDLAILISYVVVFSVILVVISKIRNRKRF